MLRVKGAAEGAEERGIRARGNELFLFGAIFLEIYKEESFDRFFRVLKLQDCKLLEDRAVFHCLIEP